MSIRELMEERLRHWVNMNRQEFNKILTSAFEDMLDEIDPYEVFFNVAHQNACDFITIDDDIEEVALEIILENI